MKSLLRDEVLKTGITVTCLLDPLGWGTYRKWDFSGNRRENSYP